MLRSNQAFNRTVAHPLDAGVRIARSTDDLLAIESRRTKAVILKGELSDEIKGELRTLRPLIPRGMTTYRGPVMHSYKDGMPRTGQYIPTLNPFRNSPRTLEHMGRLARMFKKATGQPDTMTSYPIIDVTTLNVDTKCEAEFRDTLDPKKIGWLRPQCARRMDRLLCVYSDAADSGISWIPGTFSYEEEKALQGLYMTSADPDFMLRQYNTQKLEPGDVLLLKGSFEGRDRAQLLMHKLTRPQSSPTICAHLQKNL